MEKIFPPLYKKTQTGAIQQWIIGVEDRTIITVHGQVGGAQQVSRDLVKDGTNAGKANATTPEEQALKEANARWVKQKKSRYVETIEEARAGIVDEKMVQGGIPPMLSINKSYPADPILDKYLEYPCILQPKLDGVCCIAVVKEGKASLWSRAQKPKTSTPHIVEALEKRFGNEELLVFHGELYNHDYCDRFQDLVSIINSDEPDEAGLYRDVLLCVYDLPQCNSLGISYKDPYQKRFEGYQKLLCSPDLGPKNPNSLLVYDRPLVPVEGRVCHSFDELRAGYEEFLVGRYEGGMAKNINAPYTPGKRSSEILKMKEFVDGEAKIIAVEDGRGKDAGVASVFVCEFIPPGKTEPVIVRPVMKCSYELKKKYWDRRAELPGKMLTIKYKRLTDDGIPYIPSGKAIRDYE